jgi:hypothetical protein
VDGGTRHPDPSARRLPCPRARRSPPPSAGREASRGSSSGSEITRETTSFMRNVARPGDCRPSRRSDRAHRPSDPRAGVRAGYQRARKSRSYSMSHNRKGMPLAGAAPPLLGNVISNHGTSSVSVFRVTGPWSAPPASFAQRASTPADAPGVSTRRRSRSSLGALRVGLEQLEVGMAAVEVDARVGLVVAHGGPLLEGRESVVRRARPGPLRRWRVGDPKKWFSSTEGASGVAGAAGSVAKRTQTMVDSPSEGRMETSLKDHGLYPRANRAPRRGFTRCRVLRQTQAEEAV